MVPENSSLHLDFIFIIQSLDDFSQRPGVLLLELLAACEEARSDPAAPVQRSLKSTAPQLFPSIEGYLHRLWLQKDKNSSERESKHKVAPTAENVTSRSVDADQLFSLRETEQNKKNNCTITDFFYTIYSF